MLRSFACLACALGLLGSASAQISDRVIAELNDTAGAPAAEQAGPARAAIEAASANPDDPNAAVLAFEASWRLIKAGEYETAAEGARLAAALSDDGVSTELATAIATFAEYRAEDTRNTRRALFDASRMLEASPPSAISVAILRETPKVAYVANDVDATIDMADVALAHFAQAPEPLARFIYETRLIRASAMLLDDPEIGVLEEFASLSQALDVERTKAGNTPEHWSWDLYWTSEAWELAVESLLFSAREASRRELDAVQARYPTPPSADLGLASAADDTDLPSCEFETTRMPTPNYPSRAQRNFAVGAVLIGITFDASGVAEAIPLAAVPEAFFADEAVRAVKEEMRIRWIAPDTPGSCENFRTNVVLPIVFQLGRG